jgi:hypothetical protein
MLFVRGEIAARLRAAALKAAVTTGVVAGLGMVVASADAAPPPTADGRSYEMVSPVDKNGGNVAGDNVSIVSSAAGDAVAYLSRGSFGDTIGSGSIGQTQYVARRGSSGWANRAITPTPSYGAAQIFFTTTVITGFSEDLRRAVVWGYDLPGVAGSLPKTANIYAEDTATRALELVTSPAALVDPLRWVIFDFASPDPGGVSRDSRHIAFRASTPLLPEAPADVPSVYDWEQGVSGGRGTLRLASILPDGSPASAGAALVPRSYRASVSPDGSRVTFVSPVDPAGGPVSDSQLYLRVDRAHTAWVSQPETTGPPPTPQDVVLQQVTGDSRHVIFATSSRLLDSDPNDGSDLYLYTDSANPASDANLTLVSDTGDVPGNDPLAGTAVIGSSDDAGRIYYFKNDSILLKEGSTTRTVADGIVPDSDTRLLFAATASTPGGARVSPDGRYLAFFTAWTPTRNGVPVAASDGHYEMYLYDAVADTVRCVSCPASGSATAGASIVPSVTHIFPSVATIGLRTSFLADDGRTFFSTAEALVPQDVNGVTDAYEFDPATGKVVLLSTGKGAEPASFAAASASGNDAFIVTRQQLAKADRDALVDVYDVRVGGGFPETQDPAPPCEGDSCQGKLAAVPDEALIGSRDVGAGVAPAKRVRIRHREVDGARASLRLALPAAGTVAWRGHSLRRGSDRFAKAGTPTIDVALRRGATQALAAGRVVRTTLRLMFTPIVGIPSEVVTSLTFKRPASKKGR